MNQALLKWILKLLLIMIILIIIESYLLYTVIETDLHTTRKVAIVTFLIIPITIALTAEIYVIYIECTD